jgi:hypothetical protein
MYLLPLVSYDTVVRGDGPARVAAVLDHAIKAYPELCAVEPAESIEALHAALARFVTSIVAPRIAGAATTVIMLSHGGNAMLNARGRLDGPAGRAGGEDEVSLQANELFSYRSHRSARCW